MAASGRSVLGLSCNCQQLLQLSGLKSMWLPAIVPDLVLQKTYKRMVGITNVSHTQQRQYRCTMNQQVHIPAPVLPAESESGMPQVLDTVHCHASCVCVDGVGVCDWVLHCRDDVRVLFSFTAKQKGQADGGWLHLDSVTAVWKLPLWYAPSWYHNIRDEVWLDILPLILCPYCHFWAWKNIDCEVLTSDWL